MIEVETAKNLKWANPSHTMINLLVKFSHLPSEVEFTASSNDPEPYGREFFELCLSGRFGPIEN